MIPIRDTVFCRIPPAAVIGIILLNVAVFLHERSLPWPLQRGLLLEYALIPALFTAPGGLLPVTGVDAYARLVTSTFLHGGWLHLILNMWTLWLFGCAMESRLGRVRFVVFYLACGIGAGVVHVLFNPGSQVPTIGASGAVAGVIAAYAWSYPRAEIKVLIPIVIFPLFVDVPAIGFALFWFALQLLQGYAELVQPAFGAGIAWWAHAGGFITGVVLLRLLAPDERRPRPWDHLRKG